MSFDVSEARCGICESSSVDATYQVAEMMRGSGETFSYWQCGNCGCVQIAEVPDDIGQYYGKDYYSIRHRSWIKRFVFEQRIKALGVEPSGLGRLLLRIKPPERDPSVGLPGEVSKDHRVLEVGCGNGGYLFKLHELGHEHLHGIDPYMSPMDVRTEPFMLERKTLFEMDPAEVSFDAIVMSHTLEHIAEQMSTMRRLGALLADGGIAIIRIPMIPCHAWEHYGTDWVQLDAPRHLFIHSPTSLNLLVEGAGLVVEQIVYDSTAFQFWGSEQYRRGIPLMSSRSWSVNPERSLFSPSEIGEFEVRADELNQEGRGDQVSVVVKRS